MDIWEFLGIKAFRDIQSSLDRIESKVDAMAQTYQESKQEWVDYTTALKAENTELRQAVSEAEQAAAANAEALQQFQDDDAATDAQQLADAAQAIADDLHSTLEGLKDPVAEPDPLPDNSLPGDQPVINPLQ